MDDYRPISQKELERGYFFITHRLLIKKIAYIGSIVALLIFYVFLGYRVFDYLRAPGFESSAMAIQASTFDWATYHAARSPQEISFGQPAFTALGDRKYNIAVLVENPNSQWAVRSIEYHFVSQGDDTPSQTAFIGPNEKRLLALTGYESVKAVRNPELVVSDIEWYRIDSSFPEINIKVFDVNFSAASRETIEGETIELPARVSWQAYNESVYNFWEVDWQVALYNGDKLVALNRAKTKDFLALETRNLETIWIGGLPPVTRAVIFPIINKLDPDIFKDIYVEPSTDNR